ncbi:MAG: PspC domain-containing protein [Candidatus Marinimicrobia bacterium]|jgi:phage shock protein PspC (stress-responsive transcriptional regulator)|nr:PspC domain-containing protein [Candidatus Neomarinimicrobiota bacterium]NLA22310.1 PspC domain-containing protein [Candidatus Neomarinimicrobiota bacterium]HNZ37598.1 PspC domain-containing protein [Candidatus Neomarinimicrobiota bacterium]HOD37960.1 PspC domain-containing protein [Candidatus Neomarinimicrobiota bacterium]HOG75707.1 PspC domain-containing protein [Candidatus Neomarinimicrobiota bacterium]
MKKIYRSRTDQKLAGICGGLGEIFNIDSNLIRLALVFATILTGFFPLLITYIVGWIIIPEGPVEGKG